MKKLASKITAVLVAAGLMFPTGTLGNIDFGLTAFAEENTADGYTNGFCDKYELKADGSWGLIDDNDNCTHTDCNGYQRATDDNNDGVFEIGNAGQLYWFADMIIKNGAVSAGAILTDDITVNENVLTADGELNPHLTNPRSWTPIGYPVSAYKGTFDGQGHKISGLYFNDENTTYIGLFQNVDKAGKVINVGVVDTYFSAKYFVGGICGGNSGTIENCYNAGTVKASLGSTDWLGGISGSNEGGSIIGCFNTGNISGSGCYIGGICGESGIYQQISGSIIKNCYNAGKITSSTDYIGGICGQCWQSTLENCYNTGILNAPYSYPLSGGWLIPDTVFQNCYYLDTIDYNGNEGVKKTSAEFSSGEVCRFVGYHSYMNDKCTLCGNVRLTNVSITISEPKSAENLATTASVSTTGVAADPTISWQPANTSAAYNTVYTASVTLSASTGYAFADSVTVSVNDTAVDSRNVTYNDNGTITVVYTFGATDKKTLSSSDFNFTLPDDLIYNYEQSKNAVVTAISAGVGDITAVKYFDENGTKLSSAPINAGTYTVKIDVEEGEDFEAITDLTSDSWKFTIKPKVITKSDLEFLSANFSKSYDGTTASTAKMQIKSNVVGIDAVEISGTAVYNSKDVKDAAKVTFTPTAITDGNYTLASTETVEHYAEITAKPITPTVEVTGTYSYTGTAITPTFTVKDGDTLLVKDTDYSYELSNNINVGTDTAKITVKSVINGNYSFTDTEKTFTIGKGTPSISAPTATAITYGEALSKSTLTEGWTWADDTIKPNVNNSGFTAYKTVTDYDNYDYSNLTGFDYDDTNQKLSYTVAVTVNKAKPTVTPPTATAITYGEALSQSTLTDDWNWADGTTKPNVNNSGFTAYKTVTDYDKYDYSNLTGFDYDEADHKLSCTVAVAVNKATPNVTAPTANTGLVYKGTTQELISAGSTDFGTLLYSLDGTTYSEDIPTATNADSYTVYYKVQGNANVNDSAAQTVSSSIGKAAVTITANSYTVKVGNTLPTFDYKVSGLVNNETLPITVSVSCSTTDSKTAGEYPITVSGAADSTNYTFNYVNGTLTITEKDIQTITAADVTLTYGDAGKKIGATTNGDGAITYSVKTGSDIITIAEDGTITALKAGTATVEITAAETFDYAKATKTVTVTVSKAAVTIKADDKTVYQNAALPTFTYSVTGLANGDKLSFTPVLTCEATTTSTVGTYAITVTIEITEDECYTYTTTNGTLTVKKKSSGGGGGGGGYRPTTPTTTNPSIGGSAKSWSDVAADLGKLTNGSEATIELNGNTTVPIEVIKAIADKDSKVTFVINSVSSWVIDGAEITTPVAIDLTLIKTASTKSDTLRGIEGTQFKINGTNIPTDLMIAFNKEHEGKFANLYKVVDGKLVFVTCAKLGEDGKVILPDVVDKGEYVVMLCEFSDRLGDMDNDGIMNAKDAAAILKDIVEIEPGKNPLMADFNGDGRINAMDAAAILKRIVGLA